MSDEQSTKQSSPPTPTDAAAATPIPTSAEAQAAEYLAGWKRALADYENAKKEMREARREGIAWGKVEAAEAFLGAIDALDAATKFAPDLSAADESTRKALEGWVAGVKHVQALFLSSLEGLGITRVPTSGVWNPHKHESVGERESGEPQGTILEVVAQGYTMGERLIRPARVIISAPQQAS